MKPILKAIWRTYKAVCVASISIFLLALAVMLPSEYLKHVDLPNGLAVGRDNIFNDWHEVFLWKEGRRIMKDPLDLFCLNDSFVAGSLWNGGYFIYSVEDETLVRSTDIGYHAMLIHTGLFNKTGACAGYLNTLIGPQLVLKTPELFSKHTQSQSGNANESN